MPKSSNKKRSHKGGSAPKRSRRRNSFAGRIRRPIGTSGAGSDVHHFKGTLNAGILQLPWVTAAAASTHYGGMYVFNLADLPIYTQQQDNFEFVRVNRFVMSFMPRYNESVNPSATGASTITGANQQYYGQTFITAMDEIPVSSGGTSYTNATQTWVTQNDEDSGVAEMVAVDNPNITPDYVRGLRGSKETELYKKHVVAFTPTYYVITQNFQGNTDSGFPTDYEQRKKRWLPTHAYIQGSGDLQLTGPTFHGPIYAFTQLISASPTNPTQVYDVKVRWSVSFKRQRGV